jgi:uncharacterized protein (DUF302 family)
MTDPTANPTAEGIITKTSPLSVPDTVARLLELVDGRKMKVFTVVDHSGEAHRAGLDLRDTKLVLFGSPVGGTPVMVASPLAALDLPLKVLVWVDGDQTKVSYTDPAVLAARHHIDPKLAGPLAGIDRLTDDLVAPPASSP